MFVFVIRIILFIHGLTFNIGTAARDPKQCLSTKENSSPWIKEKYCLVTKNDVKLLCPHHKVVVLSSLELAVKSNSSGCVKRILSHRDEFCCSAEDNDVLFDGHCLQDIWTAEDRVHYQSFANNALKKCDNSSRCVLDSHLFANLQTEIPISGQHSSYFQVLYKCIQTTTQPADYCSSRSFKGKEIHFQQRVTSDAHGLPCTCQITSQNNAEVIVKAVDVRNTNSELVLSSDIHTKNISNAHTPLFGFREIFSGKKVTVSLKPGSSNNDDNIWLHVSGTNGKDVTVSCGEPTFETERISTTTLPGRVATVKKPVPLGYWPIIYVAGGSVFTLVLLACIFAIVFIFRRRLKKRRAPSCYHHSLHGGLCRDPYYPPYGNVFDDTLHIPGQARSLQEQIYDKPYMKTYPRSISMKSLRPQMTPALPPPNDHEKLMDDASPPHSNAISVTPSGVSQLEDFLK